MKANLPAWASGRAAEMVLIGICVLAASYGIGAIKSWHNTAKVNGATVVAQGQKIQATTQLEHAGAVADQAKATTDTAVTTGRAVFQAATTEARRHEPETAARADRPVPASVRNAARERRLARERSAGAQSQR